MIDDHPARTTAALVSGGVDSAVLVAELCKNHTEVFPLFVRSGLIWEEAELEHLRRFLRAIECPELRPLTILDFPVRDIYGDHWGTTGQCIPDADSPDEAVYLPGRNLFLITKAAVWCVLNHVDVLALGSLNANPFSDSTPEFDAAVSDVIHKAVGGRVVVIRPFAKLNKSEVIRRSAGLPLELSFSCIHPVTWKHCGRCNKCAERRRGFEAAGRRDLTPYANDPQANPRHSG